MAKDIEMAGLENSVTPSVMMRSSTSNAAEKLSSRPASQPRLSYDEDPDFDPTDLIPEDAFANLVNLDGEIQVGGTFYKITPSGTFITSPDNIAEVYSFLDERDELKEEHVGKLKKYEAGDVDDLYQLTDEVYFMDTYALYTEDFGEGYFTLENDRSGSRSTGGDGTRPPRTSDGSRPTARDSSRWASSTRVSSRTSVRRGTRTATGTRVRGIRSADRSIRSGMDVRTSGTRGTSSTGTGSDELAIFENSILYDFHRKTKVGKWMQNFFGNPQNAEFSNDKYRLRINFYSLNWWVFSSVGIKAKFQKNTFGWWASNDFQELRIGWSPMVTEINAPVVTQYPHMLEKHFPNTNVTGAAAKMLAHASGVLIGDNVEKADLYLTLRLGDVLDAQKTFSFLSSHHQALLQKLIDKAEVDIEDYIDILKKQVETHSKGLFDEIKKNIGYPTEKKLALVGPYRLFIEDGEIIKNSGSGKIKKTLDFGLPTLTFGTDPELKKFKLINAKGAKTIRVESGTVYGAAKYNNEWRSIVVVKKKDDE